MSSSDSKGPRSFLSPSIRGGTSAPGRSVIGSLSRYPVEHALGDWARTACRSSRTRSARPRPDRRTAFLLHDVDDCLGDDELRKRTDEDGVAEIFADLAGLLQHRGHREAARERGTWCSSHSPRSCLTASMTRNIEHARMEIRQSAAGRIQRQLPPWSEIGLVDERTALALRTQTDIFEHDEQLGAEGVAISNTSISPSPTPDTS